jgi:hypothetical protein
LLILALCAFTLCNGYARILGMFGIEHEDAILMGDRETLDSKVSEGIALLRRSSSHRGTLLSKVPEFRSTSPRKQTDGLRNPKLLELV